MLTCMLLGWHVSNDLRMKHGNLNVYARSSIGCLQMMVHEKVVRHKHWDARKLVLWQHQQLSRQTY